MKTESLIASKETGPLVIVRIKTSLYKTDRGIAACRHLTFLRRKSVGHNFLEEDVNMIGADETIPRILNFSDVKDGIYQVITCNEKRDWESGMVEEYDFSLIPFE